MSNHNLQILEHSTTNEFVHVPADSGLMYWGPGDSYTVLVTGAQSGSAYFIFPQR
jgi:hypothetical protein